MFQTWPKYCQCGGEERGSTPPKNFFGNRGPGNRLERRQRLEGGKFVMTVDYFQIPDIPIDSMNKRLDLR